MTDRAEAISELLPFWVNGTLDRNEAAQIEAALASSPALQAEAAALQALRAQIKAAPVAGAAGELGLARLMRAIDAETAAQPRVSGQMRPALLAASVVLAAALSSAATYGVMQTGGDEQPVYEQASGDMAGTVLTVTFNPETTEAAISALLRDKGLVIVDGPSAIGLYRIAPPGDMTVDEAAAYLAAAPSIIATVDKAE